MEEVKCKSHYYWNPGDVPFVFQKQKLSLGQSGCTTLTFFDVRKSRQAPACQVSLEVKVEKAFLHVLYTNTNFAAVVSKVIRVFYQHRA